MESPTTHILSQRTFPTPSIDEENFSAEHTNAVGATTIAKLFNTYSYKNHQLRLEKIDKEKLSHYFCKFFLDQPLKAVFTYKNNEAQSKNVSSLSVPFTGATSIVSLKPFRLLQDALGYTAASLKDFYVDENLPSLARSAGYRTLGKWLREHFQSNEKMFVAAKVAIQDSHAIEELYACGFNYVASESIFSLHLTPEKIAAVRRDTNKTHGQHIRLARPSDHEAIKQIACTNHDINKFHLDASISPKTSAVIYKKTIEASIGNPNHTILVNEEKGRITGFITVIFNATLSKLMGRNYGSLDYISVKKECRQKGVGLALNAAGLNHLAGQNCQVISVKTLSHNYAACNLLLANQFKLASSSLILHRHQERSNFFQ